VLLSIRTAIPKTGSPWHPSLKKAMALPQRAPVLDMVVRSHPIHDETIEGQTIVVRRPAGMWNNLNT